MSWTVKIQTQAEKSITAVFRQYDLLGTFGELMVR
jgi:hypothetical protein